MCVCLSVCVCVRAHAPVYGMCVEGVNDWDVGGVMGVWDVRGGGGGGGGELVGGVRDLDVPDVVCRGWVSGCKVGRWVWEISANWQGVVET